jgi:hypothetical protein
MIENPRQDMYSLSQDEQFRGKAQNKPSIMYTEFVACYESTGQMNWLKKFIPGLKVVDNIHKSQKLYCDNNPAVQYAHNNRSSGAAKHIDIKYYVVKDKVQDQIINLEHISIEKMLADLLTKG